MTIPKGPERQVQYQSMRMRTCTRCWNDIEVHRGEVWEMDGDVACGYFSLPFVFDGVDAYYKPFTWMIVFIPILP